MREDIYHRLAKHLAALGMGYPEKEELLEILKENFTPLEAEVALAIPSKVIPFEPVPVARIEPPGSLSREELERTLSNLAQRGLLFSKRLEDGRVGYALQQFGYGFPQTFFWRGVHTPHGKELAELVAKYSRREQLEEAYGRTGTKAFRYVPASVAVEP